MEKKFKILVILLSLMTLVSLSSLAFSYVAVKRSEKVASTGKYIPSQNIFIKQETDKPSSPDKLATSSAVSSSTRQTEPIYDTSAKQNMLSVEDGSTTLVRSNPPENPYTSSTPPIGSQISEQIFFSKNGSDGSDCAKVSAVNRNLSFAMKHMISATLDELLKGPTAEESKNGYYTNLPAGIKVQNIEHNDGTGGTFKIDFSKELANITGDCKIKAARAQIINTLQAFPIIKSLTLTIDGKTNYSILQP